MRSILYWLTSSAIAVICATAAATQQAGVPLNASEDSILVAAENDPIRAILLGVGILALAYTYQRAWVNFREKSPPRPRVLEEGAAVEAITVRIHTGELLRN